MDIKKICIIEDEVDISETLKIYLEDVGYQVSTFANATEFFQNFDPDFKGLYLVDWNLPDMPGTQIIKKIRNDDKVSPIFMISAYSMQDEVIEGLRSGADDYIKKPFNFEELLVRINNANRKFNFVNKELDPSQLKLIPEARSFVFHGKTVNLTAREFIIFDQLFQRKSHPISREELVRQFSEEEDVTPRNIDVHIFSLRKKLRAADLEIDTVWGHGYKLEV
jgi:DNA-binding response OmpR family regulator